ncbi:hypothetical protein [Lacinutrix himadriensis]|uniref:hypothetical protein n=1 Tax=Lacinutrix himadriensis TaxID=641549 RepID=UPI000A52E970|nr:hypothetical protein [Lacinutrix himadriensis]
MLTTICTVTFCIVILILAFFIKKDLYTNEHEADISNELDTFDTNFKAIQEIEITDYQLGSGHLYK